ncbi:MAG: hypothetical protein ACI4MF_05605 [Candidatus Faecivicinus sp.]
MIQSETTFALGTAIAILGLALFLAVHPVYNRVCKMQRRRVEARILQLCRELMK